MSKIFPQSANRLPLQIIVYLVVLVGLATAGVTYYLTPKYTRVGYAPIQPVPFSHAKHVQEIGLDCRYCHSNVEKSGHSNVPTSQTCMNCHGTIKKDSPLLAPIRQSYATGEAVPWVWVHKTPDYAYFNHSAHVNRGVSCVECHGNVNAADVVTHEKSLSMGFCIECHRNPEGRVREKADIFNLDSKTIADKKGTAAGEKFVHDWNIKPPQSCSGCHR